MLNVSNALIEKAFRCSDRGTTLFSISASHYAEVCSLPTKDWRASLAMRISKFLLLEYPRHLNLGNEVRMRIPYRTLAKWNISSIVEWTHLRGRTIRTRFSVHESIFQALIRFVQMDCPSHTTHLPVRQHRRLVRRDW